MPAFPTITTTTAVTITSLTNVSYNNILNSLGAQQYQLNYGTFISTNLNQLIQPNQFTTITADGKTNIFSVAPVYNSFTSGQIPQISIDYEKLRSSDIVFDQTTHMNFTLLPNTTLLLVLDMVMQDYTNLLTDIKNFEEVPKIYIN